MFCKILWWAAGSLGCPYGCSVGLNIQLMMSWSSTQRKYTPLLSFEFWVLRSPSCVISFSTLRLLGFRDYRCLRWHEKAQGPNEILTMHSSVWNITKRCFEVLKTHFHIFEEDGTIGDRARATRVVPGPPYLQLSLPLSLPLPVGREWWLLCTPKVRKGTKQVPVSSCFRDEWFWFSSLLIFFSGLLIDFRWLVWVVA